MADITIPVSDPDLAVIDQVRGDESREDFLSSAVSTQLVPVYQAQLDAQAAAVVVTALHSGDPAIQAAYGELLALINAPPSFLDGLLFYFNFDETSGNRASVVESYVLEEVNGPITKVDDAAHLSNYTQGPRQDFLLPDAEAIRTGHRDWTIALRLRIHENDGQYNTPAIMGKWTYPTHEFELFIKYDTAEFDLVWYEIPKVGNGTLKHLKAPLPTRGDPPVPALGDWFTVVFSHDEAAHEFSLWVNNGTPVTSVDYGGPDSGDKPYHVGSTRGTDGFLNGDFYALCMHDRVWSQEDHDWFYNGGAGRKLVV